MEEEKEYQLGNLKVIWKPHLCRHSGVCADTLINVQTKKEESNPTGYEKLRKTIDRCPSGALTYTEEKKDSDF